MSRIERTTTPVRGERPAPAWFNPLPTLPPFVFEGALAAVQVAGSFAAAQGQPDRDSPDALGVALLIAGPAVLTVRNRYPAAVGWAVGAITIAYMLLGYAYGPVVFSFVVALFTAVMTGQRLAAWSAAAGLYAGHFGLRLLFDIDSDPTLGQFAGVGAALLAVLAASEVVRARRDWAIEAERTREEETRGRASEERLRIARELHDVLAHHISLMNVQAGVALHLMDRKPEQARTALTAIEAASREALGELRSVLDILQRPDEAPRAPAPSLGRLDGLTSQARAAGLDVRTEIEGSPRPLPGPIDAAAFRVVQEALTNVIRHARAARATVSVRYGERQVAVQVDDDGNGPRQSGPATGGSGIAGMRERVTALRGSFEAGPLPGRGFRVRAELPLDTAT